MNNRSYRSRFNIPWIHARFRSAYRINQRIIHDLETGNITTSRALLKAVMPLYQEYFYAWNGAMSRECETDLRKVAIDVVLTWRRCPLGFAQTELIQTLTAGLVHLEEKTGRNRRIPGYLLPYLVSNFREGSVDYCSLNELKEGRMFLSETIGGFFVELAHCLHHTNYAVNSALWVSSKQVMSECLNFYNHSRWPQAVAAEFGPHWLVEIQRKMEKKGRIRPNQRRINCKDLC